MKRMEELYQYRSRLLQRLEEIIAEMRTAATSLEAEDWGKPLAGSGMTPHRLLAQMRDNEERVFHERTRRVLSENTPFLPLISEEAHPDAYDPNEPPQKITTSIARLREQQLEWLRPLQPTEWNRSGRHPWFGLRTLQWWVEKGLLLTEERLKLLADRNYTQS
jgi:hypothetical protein